MSRYLPVLGVMLLALPAWGHIVPKCPTCGCIQSLATRVVALERRETDSLWVKTMKFPFPPGTLLNHSTVRAYITEMKIRGLVFVEFVPPNKGRFITRLSPSEVENVLRKVGQ